MKRKFRYSLILLCMLCISGLLLSSCRNAANTAARKTDNGNEPAAVNDINGDGIVKIGYSISSEHETFANLCKDRIVDRMSKKHPDWELLIKTANYDIRTEIENTKSFIQDNCDIIIFHAVDTYDSVASVELCNKAGIPCITIVNEVSDGNRIHVGGKNYECGQMIADYIRDRIPENGTICFLMGPAGSANSADRVNGFKDYLDRDDVKILDEQCGDWMIEKGYAIMKNWLQEYDNISMVFSCSDTMTPGAIRAIEEGGKANRIIVTSVDCSRDGLQLLDSNKIACDMLYNTNVISEKTIGICERLLAGENEIDDEFFSFELITQQRAKETIDWYFSE